MTTHAQTCWYQKHDLLACATKHGFSVTESRFDEWVERGLMREAAMRLARTRFVRLVAACTTSRQYRATYTQSPLEIMVNCSIPERHSPPSGNAAAKPAYTR